MLILDNPDQRNAMSDEMTASWVERGRRARRRPRRVRAVVVTGRGLGVLLRRQHLVDRQRARRDGGPPAHPDDGVLPGLALDPAARGARRSRRSTAPAIGAGLCMALACDIRYAAAGAKMGVPFVKLGMHAGMAGTYLLPERRRARRTPATCCSPAASSTPTRRCASAWSPRVIEPRRLPRRGARDRRRASPRTAPIASRLTKLALRDGGHADFESAPAVGGDGPADHAGHRGPAGGHPGRPREAAAGLHRRLIAEPGRRARRGPRSAWRHLPSPCECRSTGRGPHLGPTLGARPVARSMRAPRRTPVDKPVDNLWTNGPSPVEKPARRGRRPVDDTPGRDAVRLP